MNETVSDTESPSSDSESPVSEFKHASLPAKSYQKLSTQKAMSMQARPISLPLGTTQPLLQPLTQPMTEADFFARQARLQTEARMALAQAKEMAHMQMEVCESANYLFLKPRFVHISGKLNKTIYFLYSPLESKTLR